MKNKVYCHFHWINPNGFVNHLGRTIPFKENCQSRDFRNNVRATKMGATTIVSSLIVYSHPVRVFCFQWFFLSLSTLVPWKYFTFVCNKLCFYSTLCLLQILLSELTGTREPKRHPSGNLILTNQSAWWLYCWKIRGGKQEWKGGRLEVSEDMLFA